MSGVVKKVTKEVSRATRRVAREVGRAGDRVGREVSRTASRVGREVKRQPGGVVGTIATGGANTLLKGSLSAGRSALGQLGLGAPVIEFPEEEEALVAPMVDEEAVARARRRAAAQAARGSGRDSTILTGGTLLG